MTDKVRLLSFESGKTIDNKAAWVVSLGYFTGSSDPDPMLTTTFKLSKADFDEANVIRVARHFFQGLCGAVSQETSGWKLEPDQFAALKRDAKSQ